MDRDNVMTDVAYALKQLCLARQKAGMENARQALDSTQRAIDALERVQEALEVSSFWTGQQTSWIATIAYRKDDGMAYSQPTASTSLVVEAEDAQDARGKAIDKAYRELPGPISHVTVKSVESV